MHWTCKTSWLVFALYQQWLFHYATSNHDSIGAAWQTPFRAIKGSILTGV